MFVVMALMAVAAAWTATSYGATDTPGSISGAVSGWSLRPTPHVGWTFAVAATLDIGIAVLIFYLNKTYNLLRTLTALQSTTLMAMLASTPAALSCVYPGNLLALAVVLCMFIMYGSYGERQSTRNVYLCMLILSWCTAFAYSFALYIPVFIFGCVQMRIFSLRSLLATLMGLATPWVIMLGFGLVSPAQLQLPDFRYEQIEMSPQTPALIASVAFTCFLAVGCWIQNIMRFLTYNAHSRALLSLLTVVTFATVTAAIADFSNAYAYIPLLDVCAALQLAHTFGVMHRQKRSYIAIFSILMIYILIYTWKILLSI